MRNRLKMNIAKIEACSARCSCTFKWPCTREPRPKAAFLIPERLEIQVHEVVVGLAGRVCVCMCVHARACVCMCASSTLERSNGR